jgi:muramoyltetrapeptide carboxypeptidase
MQKLISLLALLALTIPSVATNQFRWSPLEKDDFIDVIAPGSGAHDGSVDKTKANIKKFGFNYRIPADLINPQPLGHANTKEYRTNHLKTVLSNDETKVIWAIRGGRGSSSLLDSLTDIKAAPKLVVGYSDITAIHLWAAKRNWPSLHAIVLAYNQEANPVVNGKSSMKEVIDILTGTEQVVHYTLTPLNEKAKSGEVNIDSSVIGGNLSVIQRSIGTETALNATGRILFLEDTGEPASKANDIFTQLDRAGTLNGIKGLVLGNFKDDNIAQYNFLKGEIGHEMDKRGIPLFTSEEFGHGPVNHPLPFNTPAVLKSNGSEILFDIRTNN